MRISSLVVVVLLQFVLVGCSGAPVQPPATNNAGSDQIASLQSETTPPTDSSEMEDYNWVIYVQDSSTIAFGPMQMDFTIDLKAVNTSGQIYGQYIGSATTKAVSHMESGGGTINAPVEGNSTSLVINVNPAVEDEDKLASLTEKDADDEKLAPLVPSDDGELAPLVDPNNKLDYEGSGTMVLQSGGTGTISAGGFSASRGIGNTSSNQLEVFIKGTSVRLAVTIPEVGTVYFDGFIRGEGKK